MIKKLLDWAGGSKENRSFRFPTDEENTALLNGMPTVGLAFEQARGEMMTEGSLDGLSPDSRVNAIEGRARMVLARTIGQPETERRAAMVSTIKKQNSSL